MIAQRIYGATVTANAIISLEGENDMGDGLMGVRDLDAVVASLDLVELVVVGLEGADELAAARDEGVVLLGQEGVVEIQGDQFQIIHIDSPSQAFIKSTINAIVTISASE